MHWTSECCLTIAVKFYESIFSLSCNRCYKWYKCHISLTLVAVDLKELQEKGKNDNMPWLHTQKNNHKWKYKNMYHNAKITVSPTKKLSPPWFSWSSFSKLDKTRGRLSSSNFFFNSAWINAKIKVLGSLYYRPPVRTNLYWGRKGTLWEIHNDTIVFFFHTKVTMSRVEQIQETCPSWIKSFYFSQILVTCFLLLHWRSIVISWGVGNKFQLQCSMKWCFCVNIM